MAYESLIHSPAAAAVCGVADGSATAASLTDLHPEILKTHILKRLDGPTLASAASTSSQIYNLATDQTLWSDICRSTWPSTDTPRLRHVISNFPNGSLSFFSDSFPLFSGDGNGNGDKSLNAVTELISAVDIYYRGEPIFSKVVETETVTGWFRCSPFRIDMLDPKDVIPTPIRFPAGDDICRNMAEDLTLSWIIINSNGGRAMNVSSFRPESVQRHWLSGEVHVRYATILGGDRGSAREHVQCGVVVTCGGLEGGGLQVREVNLQVEDMDGIYLSGRDSLVILNRGLEGKRGKIGMTKFEEFLEMKRERKERKLRNEGNLDIMCVGFCLLGFAGFCIFLLLR